MKLLKPATKELAFAKVGFLGFAKSGKTFTATQMAIGLASLINAKTIGFLDTETGSDFMIPLFEQNNLDLVVAKTRAFKDLLDITREAEHSCDILIIDSVSHIWNDLLQSYMKKKKKTRLDFQDWAIIKPTWGEFTDLFLTSKLHIIFAARAAFEWDYFKDEETGKMELHKTGTKMRAESEFGFEPSLLIEMERIKNNREFIHRAWVLGDRAQLLDGQHFDNPTFETFLPHFQYLNLGGEHMPLDISRDSTQMFDIEGRPDWKTRKIKKEKALEEIEAYITSVWPGTTKEEKSSKRQILEIIFATPSWTHIKENIALYELELAARRLDLFRTRYLDKVEAYVDVDAEKRLQMIWTDVCNEYDLIQEEKSNEPRDPQETGKKLAKVGQNSGNISPD